MARGKRAKGKKVRGCCKLFRCCGCDRCAEDWLENGSIAGLLRGRRSLQGPLIPRMPCVPTLYQSKRLDDAEMNILSSKAEAKFKRSGDKVTFRAEHELVVNALAGDSFEGRVWLTADMKQAMLNRIAESAEWGSNPEDGLKVETIAKWAAKNRKLVRELPEAVQGILNAYLVEEALDRFDVDEDGRLKFPEWSSFLEHLELLRIRFLVTKRHQETACFWGRGEHLELDKEEFATLDNAGLAERLRILAGPTYNPEAGERSRKVAPRDDDAAADDLERMQTEESSLLPPSRQLWPFRQFGRDPDAACLIPPGWWSDFVYYSANHHALHGLFCVDQCNRFNKTERAITEVLTISFAVVLIRSRASYVVQNLAPVPMLTNGFWYDLIVLTIPGMILWQFIFLLFTCPRLGMANPSKQQRSQVRTAEMFTTLGAMIAYVTCFVMVTAVVADEARRYKLTAVILWQVLQSRFKAYFISWAFYLLVPFNLLIAWGTSEPLDKKNTFADWIGIGQWRIEKQRFQGRLCDAADFLDRQVERGFDNMELFMQHLGVLHAVKYDRSCVGAAWNCFDAPVVDDDDFLRDDEDDAW